MVQESFSAMSSQKKSGPTAVNLQGSGGEPLPDLTDFMDDWFFGSVLNNVNRAAHNNSSGRSVEIAEEEEENEEMGTAGGVKNNQTSRLTQEWLEEAKKKVAAGSPQREGSSLPKAFGSPRFVAAAETREPPALFDRRDPLSRSARRHKSLEGISDEILRRSSLRHHLNRTCSSDYFLPPGDARSAAGNPQHPPVDNSDNRSGSPTSSLPPKLPIRRTSRFRRESSPELHSTPASAAASQAPASRRTFRSRSPILPPAEDGAPRQPLLSPPRNLVESVHRRSVSSTTCSLEAFSRPEKENASATFLRAFSPSSDTSDCPAEASPPADVKHINAFLKRQRSMIGRISRGEVSAKAKIILSRSSTSFGSTSSMVAAICYAWLLWNREEEEVVVPVENIKRERMHKHKQAAWLFHHVGIDASALLFADEADLENLLMAKQLSILVIGQDVLKTNNEVGSLCTILTDNYCEEAYDLLQNPNLKMLLLAGILLDTCNLNDTTQFVTKRDAEAVQLLSVGSAPNYRHEFFDQLMEDHTDSLFLEALENNYGKRTHEAKEKPQPVLAPTSAPPPVKAAPEKHARGKNKFFLAKWFGFGSK